MYIHAYMYMYIHTCARTHAHNRAHPSLFTHPHPYTHVHTQQTLCKPIILINITTYASITSKTVNAHMSTSFSTALFASNPDCDPANGKYTEEGREDKKGEEDEYDDIREGEEKGENEEIDVTIPVDINDLLSIVLDAIEFNLQTPCKSPSAACTSASSGASATVAQANGRMCATKSPIHRSSADAEVFAQIEPADTRNTLATPPHADSRKKTRRALLPSTSPARRLSPNTQNKGGDKQGGGTRGAQGQEGQGTGVEARVQGRDVGDTTREHQSKKGDQEDALGRIDDILSRLLHCCTLHTTSPGVTSGALLHDSSEKGSHLHEQPNIQGDRETEAGDAGRDEGMRSANVEEQVARWGRHYENEKAKGRGGGIRENEGDGNEAKGRRQSPSLSLSFSQPGSAEWSQLLGRSQNSQCAVTSRSDSISPTSHPAMIDRPLWGFSYALHHTCHSCEMK